MENAGQVGGDSSYWKPMSQWGESAPDELGNIGPAGLSQLAQYGNMGGSEVANLIGATAEPDQYGMVDPNEAMVQAGLSNVTSGPLGLLAAFNAQKQATENNEKIQRQLNVNAGWKQLSRRGMMPNQASYTQMMPNGGNVGSETVELEKGEPFKLPDGTIESIPVSAPSHKQGGVPITLPYGTKVLGKKKAWNGKEFKEMGRKLKSSQKRYQDSLESNPTSIATNTARRMLKNINIDYGKLFDEQGVDVGSPMMSRGGKVGLRRGYNGMMTGYTSPWKRAYPNSFGSVTTKEIYNMGGTGTDWDNPFEQEIDPNFQYVVMPEQPVTTTNNTNVTTPNRTNTNTNVKPTRPINNSNKNTVLSVPINGTPDRRASSFDAYLAGEGLPLNTNNYTKSYTNPDPIKSTPLSSINNSRQSTTDWNNTLNTLGALAPTMYNMYQGLKPAKQVTENQFSNPYESMARSMMNRRKYNVQPELERNALATATYNRGLMESGASPSQMRGGRLAGLVGQRRADAETLARAQNVNAQYMADQARFEYDAGQNVAARRAMVYDLNERERAVRQNYMAAGLGQLSQYSQMNQLQNNQMLRDEQRLALLPSLTPDFTLDPSTGMMIHNPSKIQFTQDEYNKYYIKGRK